MSGIVFMTAADELRRGRMCHGGRRSPHPSHADVRSAIDLLRKVENWAAPYVLVVTVAMFSVVVLTVAGCFFAWGGLVIPFLRPLYDYAWFVGFFAAGGLHVALMSKIRKSARRQRGGATLTSKSESGRLFFS